jgi:hypothetical protein
MNAKQKWKEEEEEDEMMNQGGQDMERTRQRQEEEEKDEGQPAKRAKHDDSLKKENNDEMEDEQQEKLKGKEEQEQEQEEDEAEEADGKEDGEEEKAEFVCQAGGKSARFDSRTLVRWLPPTPEEDNFTDRFVTISQCAPTLAAAEELYYFNSYTFCQGLASYKSFLKVLSLNPSGKSKYYNTNTVAKSHFCGQLNLFPENLSDAGNNFLKQYVAGTSYCKKEILEKELNLKLNSGKFRPVNIDCNTNETAFSTAGNMGYEEYTEVWDPKEGERYDKCPAREVSSESYMSNIKLEHPQEPCDYDIKGTMIRARFTISTSLFTDGIRIRFTPEMNMNDGRLVPLVGQVMVLVRITDQRIEAGERPCMITKEDYPVLLNLNDILSKWSAWIPLEAFGCKEQNCGYFTLYCTLSTKCTQ